MCSRSSLKERWERVLVLYDAPIHVTQRKR